MLSDKDVLELTKPPDGYILAACRLCGELWFIPERYADQFNADRGFECSYCTRSIKSK